MYTGLWTSTSLRFEQNDTVHTNDGKISDNELRNLDKPQPTTGLQHSLEKLTTNNLDWRRVAVESVCSSIFSIEIDCKFEDTID